MFNYFRRKRQERAAVARRRKFLGEVAAGLRLAAQLMNEGGKHWTTGSLMKVLDGIGQVYCAIGGLNAAFKAPQEYHDTSLEEGFEIPATLTAAKRFLADAIATTMGNADTDRWERYRNDPEISEAYLVKVAEDVIVTFNDSETARLTGGLGLAYNAQHEARYKLVAAKLEEAAVLAETEAARL